ncbi:glycosyltransferase family 4 protein [Limosilactobacillus reuteri]|uniref:glycosyltransferase family 4 protein n=1 Tax=Limosilactobacillus reuteri TaxID=1598 RepID=UPI000A2DD16F|nr:glycosyltransferase family 4 protein [Limosilactobacillus reuteri]OTA49466.1 1,2-diacylglycerol 3-glucosyltransferase [Limosilactobacillus reuteri]OTA55332.1 1,2-diacylglycerol 3-glucosyltransferase [Limosilactobacillus reuteri]OTA71466.1 1,2-diacylglycerol 3-glucosyltransferase [Limosilactobacillus reuteri]OTA71935.1 1,2-diacylglycerol 3-glucosyltransferase [Limosilactobacillus reuteri]OTA77323.1 1,2-diacylglycerol 3-glucosyltransferase [Limosilactobacillus reuteri]
MNIGIFTDTYFPQVSGVATSIKTLRDELIAQGHHVYIFTTTDPKAKHDDVENGIYRFASIPFVSFSDRRIAVRGVFRAIKLAKKFQLDIVHNQTEFALGVMGKTVAKHLHIPCLHTYHTMYQDYLHYIANGHILKPNDVARLAHLYLKNISGIIAPSDRVLDTLTSYHVESPIRVIPTGINLRVYSKRDSAEEIADLRAKLGYGEETPVLLSLSRLAYEKNIHSLIEAMPDILAHKPDAQLLIVGDGPARHTLERQVREMQLNDNISFAGEISNDEVYHYYQMADVFVSASDSESQGLTYDEALASDLPIVVMRSEYTDQLIDDAAIGISFQKRADLVKGVLFYLNQPKNSESRLKRQQKLHEISAEVFVEKVVQFYQDCQNDMSVQDELNQTEKSHRLFHRPRS